MVVKEITSAQQRQFHATAWCPRQYRCEYPSGTESEFVLIRKLNWSSERAVTRNWCNCAPIEEAFKKFPHGTHLDQSRIEILVGCVALIHETFTAQASPASLASPPRSNESHPPPATIVPPRPARPRALPPQHTPHHPHTAPQSTGAGRWHLSVRLRLARMAARRPAADRTRSGHNRPRGDSSRYRSHAARPAPGDARQRLRCRRCPRA